jgi:thiol-disulfide isomerase/thioredoxin
MISVEKIWTIFTLTCLIVVWHLAPLKSQQVSDSDMLTNYGILRSRELAFDYTIRWHHKSFSSSDTIVETAKVRLVRKELDTILGGWISVLLDTMWYGYDGTTIYAGNMNTANLLKANAIKYPNIYFGGSTIGDFVEKGFLYKLPGPIQAYNDPGQEKFVYDSIIHGKTIRVFVFQLPDDGEVTSRYLEVGIDPNSLHVAYRIYSALFQENEQYTLWEFTEPRYHDDTHIPEFDSVFLNKFKVVSDYERQDTAIEDTIEFQYDKLAGKVLNKGDSIRLSDSQGEFTILDFWYTACYPCIKSIPSVNRIAEKYAGSNVKVFGVNPIDSEEKDMGRLLKFIRNNPMTYNTIMVDSSIKQALNLDGYPTFIILDKDLKIIYKEVGFSETLFDEVCSFLDARL